MVFIVHGQAHDGLSAIVHGIRFQANINRGFYEHSTMPARICPEVIILARKPPAIINV